MNQQQSYRISKKLKLFQLTKKLQKHKIIAIFVEEREELSNGLKTKPSIDQ